MFPTSIEWHGETYDVPDIEDLQAMVMDGVCETPEGEAVEPDHPDSWLALIGAI